ncbi:hypothetical protein B0I35DRAFT_414338 [Stachybotrys elegans]|uniref:Uncharacterized protein n=1 Tax=Stachybotrys elegans TaxID=80388 RepID=A0A8K0SJF5_9HYPO|nr:hypothetical protein B0I35DRAFT_414338 [Stachybotrys elegans]
MTSANGPSSIRASQGPLDLAAEGPVVGELGLLALSALPLLVRLWGSGGRGAAEVILLYSRPSATPSSALVVAAAEAAVAAGAASAGGFDPSAALLWVWVLFACILTGTSMWWDTDDEFISLEPGAQGLYVAVGIKLFSVGSLERCHRLFQRHQSKLSISIASGALHLGTGHSKASAASMSQPKLPSRAPLVRAFHLV